MEQRSCCRPNAEWVWNHSGQSCTRINHKGRTITGTVKSSMPNVHVSYHSFFKLQPISFSEITWFSSTWQFLIEQCHLSKLIRFLPSNSITVSLRKTAFIKSFPFPGNSFSISRHIPKSYFPTFFQQKRRCSVSFLKKLIFRMHMW